MSDFWARRKAAVLAEEKESVRLAQAQLQSEREADMAERTDEDILAELDLPDPDTMEEGDDFKVFLTEAVPARIRTRALRRLWRLNPVLANVDGLVDYGEDFTDASCVVENLQTAYQVGKGMTQHVLEMARKAEDDTPFESTPDEDMPEEDEPVLQAQVDPTEVQELDIAPADASTGETAIHEPYPAEDLAAAAPRRMRFAFDTPQPEPHT
ncbi:DUF3306 domain-containing protein [Aliiroseovarius sp. F20344]|uniref:DUF3306 domain-containing protein n=1 Tax=Aliiroseovarius sp. F20344 TaxID=2926414 RepID=UPI001FF2FB47|nr:DUF3306 domain-containing protein [Aliiroseovarius sp. F20344]MCK0142963.1 DUF3306 domain-containing protein [Aliiroseovarius sp. F20344]